MSAFLNVRQGSRSVDEYSLAFCKASMLAGKMPEAMVVTLYTQGLHPTIGSEVARHLPPHLTEAMRLARWAEHANKMAKQAPNSSAPAPRPSNNKPSLFAARRPNNPGTRPGPNRPPPQRTNQQGAPRQVGPCHNCGRMGHVRADCRLPGGPKHDPNWRPTNGKPQGTRPARIPQAQLRAL